MKDRAAAAATTSAVSLNDPLGHRLLPSYHPLDGHQHHDHRFNKKSQNGVDDDDSTVWRELKARGAADANLLANSLTSRLRKAARQRAVASPGVANNSATSRYTVTSAGEGEEGESDEGRDRERGKYTCSSAHKRPSILKRTLSKEEAERNSRNLFGQPSPRADPSYDDFHLPNLHRHFSREYINDDDDRRNGHATSGKTNAFSGGGNGGGEGGEGYTSSNGSQLVWVKRDGIFQPADKYTTGRQTLYGEDQPYTHNQPVDYETVTLRSQADSPDSAWGTTSGWSSGKSLRRKGLKVSWKTPADRQGTAGEDRAGAVSAGVVTTSASSNPFRHRSAGTVQSDMAYRFHKLKFNPGRNRVPLIGVRWKVQVPMAGRGGGGRGGDGSGGGTEGGSSGHSSPPFSPNQPQLPKSQPLVLNQQHQQQQQQQQQQNGGQSSGSSSKPSSRCWRAMLPRDVHPVTTAMEREGTSVTRTKWHVPTTRKVAPPYTLMEDLLESRVHQWSPVALHKHAQNVLRGQKVGRYTTRATLDVQSFDHRVDQDAQDPAPSAHTTTTTTTTTSTSVVGDSAIITGYGGGGEEYMDYELHGES